MSLLRFIKKKLLKLLIKSNELYGRDQQRNSGNAETNQHTKS